GPRVLLSTGDVRVRAVAGVGLGRGFFARAAALRMLVSFLVRLLAPRVRQCVEVAGLAARRHCYRLTGCGCAGLGPGLRGGRVAEQRTAFLLAEPGAAACRLAQLLGAAGLALRRWEGVGGDRACAASPGDRAQNDFVAAQAHQVAVVQPRLDVM